MQFIMRDNVFAYLLTKTQMMPLHAVMRIKTVRLIKGQNIGIEYIPLSDAQEILTDMDLIEDSAEPSALPGDTSSIFTKTPMRIELDNIPSDLQAWIDRCDESDGMYITVYHNSYVFYCNQIRSYAWQPTLKDHKMTIALTELNGAGDGYALITIPGYEELTVTLNGTSVAKRIVE